MDSEDKIIGILVAPGPVIEHSPTLKQCKSHFDEHDIPTTNFQNADLWRIAHITNQLGFPLKVSIKPTSDGGNEPNNCIAGLFCGFDTANNQSFARTPLDPKENKGSFLIVRCDGKALRQEEFEFFNVWFNNIFGYTKIPEFWALSRKITGPVKQEILWKLKPRAFAAAYEKHRKQQVAESNEVWEVLTCPVDIQYSDMECAFCEAGDGDDGKGLKRCIACRKAHYCSPYCQKKDWKQHKLLCRLAGASQDEGTT